MTRRSVLTFALLILVPACNDNRAEPVRYAAQHARSIVSSTRPLWIRYAQQERWEIPPSEYTADMRALRPDQVFRTPEGVWMRIDTVPHYRTGVFVRFDPAFPTPGTLPPDSVETKFQRLGQEVFWFATPR